MQIGSTCAAANFAIVFGDCYYHVLSSYCDSELTRYGPGTLHLRELLAYAIQRGLRLFDFTIGDEHYKLEWSDLRLKLYDYSKGATWRGRLAICSRRHGAGPSASSSKRRCCGAGHLACVRRSVRACNGSAARSTIRSAALTISTLPFYGRALTLDPV